MDYTSQDDWQLGAGDLWFGVKQLEGAPCLCLYDGEKFTYLVDPVPEDRMSDWDYGVTRIARGKGGRLWVAMWGAVLGYDGESNVTQANRAGRRDPGHSGGPMMPRPGDAPEGAASFHRVFAIGEDRAGNIWFGAVEQSGDGVYKFNGESFDRIH